MRVLRACATALAATIAISAPGVGDASPLTLSAAGSRRVSELGAEWRASVSLVVPFDRVFGPRVSSDFGARPKRNAFAESAETAPPSTEDESEAAEPEAPAPSRRAARTAGERRPVHSGAAVTPPLARRAVREALRAAGFPAQRRRLTSLAARARSSAVLPELRLAGGRASDQTLRLTPTATDPYGYTQTGGSDLWAEARLTWRLDRLVFADDELAVERLSNQRLEAELRLVTRVLKTLFVWERARARAIDADALPDERLLARFEQMEAEATLDVLTDGWFSGWLDRAGQGAAK